MEDLPPRGPHRKQNLPGTLHPSKSSSVHIRGATARIVSVNSTSHSVTVMSSSGRSTSASTRSTEALLPPVLPLNSTGGERAREKERESAPPLSANQAATAETGSDLARELHFDFTLNGTDSGHDASEWEKDMYLAIVEVQRRMHRHAANGSLHSASAVSEWPADTIDKNENMLW